MPAHNGIFTIIPSWPRSASTLLTLAAGITAVLSWLFTPSLGAQSLDSDEVDLIRRTPLLSEAQAYRYMDYAEFLLSDEQYEQTLPVLNLLITADGVPEPVQQRSQRLLEELSTEEYPSLEWDGSLSLFASATRDEDVGGDNNGKLDSFDADASLSIGYRHNESLSAFIEVGVASGTYLDEDSELAAEPEFYRDETWIDVDFSTDTQNRSLTLGSQSVYEDRGWWWDETLDLVLLNAGDDRWFLKSGIGVQASHRLFGERFDGNDEVIRGLGELTFQWHDQQTTSLFMLGEFDQSERLQPGTSVDESSLDDRGNKLYWLGIRSQGTIDQEVWPSVDYWIDLAHVGGQEIRYDQDSDESEDDTVVVADSNRIDLDGWGMDLGVSMQTSLPAKPRLSVGFATTFNGGKVNDDTDRTFRQTGLQSNEMQLEPYYGASSYGLVLNPELSNLQILTLGIGFDVLTSSYVSLLGHDYHMLSAAESLRSADLDLTFDGNQTHAGRAIDLNLSVEELDSWDIEMQVGLFQAGKAVVDNANGTAYYGSVELSVDF